MAPAASMSQPTRLNKHSCILLLHSKINLNSSLFCYVFCLVLLLFGWFCWLLAQLQNAVERRVCGDDTSLSCVTCLTGPRTMNQWHTAEGGRARGRSHLYCPFITAARPRALRGPLKRPQCQVSGRSFGARRPPQRPRRDLFPMRSSTSRPRLCGGGPTTRRSYLIGRRLTCRWAITRRRSLTPSRPSRCVSW